MLSLTRFVLSVFGIVVLDGRHLIVWPMVDGRVG